MRRTFFSGDLNEPRFVHVGAFGESSVGVQHFQGSCTTFHQATVTAGPGRFPHATRRPGLGRSGPCSVHWHRPRLCGRPGRAVVHVGTREFFPIGFGRQQGSSGTQCRAWPDPRHRCVDRVAVHGVRVRRRGRVLVGGWVRRSIGPRLKIKTPSPHPRQIF